MIETVTPESITHGTEHFNFAVYRHGIINYEYQFPTHWHEEYEIIYCKGGTFSFLVNGQSLCVKKNQAVFIDRYAIHTSTDYDTMAGGGYVSFLFGKKLLFPDSSSYISERFYSEIDSQKVTLTQLISGEVGWQQEMLTILHAVDHLSLQPTENAFSIQINLLTIFEKLLRAKSYLPIQNKLITQNQFIKAALIYFHQNFDEKISISDTAASLHVSTNHFIRTFKSILGTTPQKYIQSLCIQKAVAIIQSGVKLRISDISIEAGFDDVNYFSRIFKKTMGVTPTQYIGTVKIEKT